MADISDVNDVLKNIVTYFQVKGYEIDISDDKNVLNISTGKSKAILSLVHDEKSIKPSSYSEEIMEMNLKIKVKSEGESLELYNEVMSVLEFFSSPITSPFSSTINKITN